MTAQAAAVEAVTLKGALLTGSRVEHDSDPKTGLPRLRVILPRSTRPEVYDLTPLLQAPGWAPLLAEGFRMRAERNATTTIYSEYLTLLRIAAFLEPASRDPLDADEAYWAAFIAWMDAPQKNGEPLSPKKRKEDVGILRRTLAALLDSAKYRSIVEQIFYRTGFSVNPYPGADRKSLPTSVLRPDERQRLIEACVGDVEHVRRLHEQQEILLRQGMQRLAEARAKGERWPYDELGVCAARLHELTDGHLLSAAEVGALDPPLMTAIGGQHGGLNVIRSILYCTSRDLVPFVVLLAIRTAIQH